MAYCMYLRKSRADVEAEARGEGETLARHEKTLMELAVRIGITISPEAIYREIVSGESIAARPVMQQVLSEIEQGAWDGVLVMEVERLARGDTIDQGIVAQTFKYSGTKIVTPAKTYDPNNEYDEEYFEFGLFMSRREYKTINRRLQRGREMSVREGKYVGNISPYGYRRQKLDHDKGFTLVPDPDESKIVRMVYEWFTGHERLGVSITRNRLNTMRVPTRKGGPWSDETVRGILTNPVYIGKIRWLGRPQVKRMVNGEMVRERPRANNPLVVEGKHDAIIDADIFQRAQDLFATNATAPVPSKRTLQNPLAGIVVCGVCGRMMVRRPHQTGYPDSLICTGPECSNVGSHLYLVERRLLESLGTWLEKYRLKISRGEEKGRRNAVEAEAIRRSAERLDSEISATETQIGKLQDLLEQGVYSVETFMSRTKFLNERLAQAKADRNTLERKLLGTASHIELQKAFIPRVERVIEVYKSMESAAEKNQLLKEVLEKAVYTKERANRGWPDAFELEIYPCLPS